MIDAMSALPLPSSAARWNVSTFVRDITTNPDDAAIAEIIIDIARTLKLSVIAEGVETRAQMQFLSFNNCVEMQGYLFSRPVRAEEFANLLKNGLKY